VIPDHLINELRYIEIYTRRRFQNLRAGTNQSRLRGPGFDFDQHRIYRQGDDVRRIDWNVTARLNAPYVRETHAEREMNVVIAVDVSQSMELGTVQHTKKELQLLIAACLVFSSLADQINTGFLSFSNQVISYHPPRRNRAQAWRFLGELWSTRPQKGETHLLPAIRHLDEHFRQEGIVFLISDFLNKENIGDSRELKILASKHDIVAVVIEDPIESELPQGNSMIELQDIESGIRRKVGLSALQRQRYAEAMQRRRKELVETFYSIPMDYIFIQSDQYAIGPLLKLFATRRRA